MGNTIDAVLKSIVWTGGAVASLLSLNDLFHSPPMTKKEREEFLDQDIRRAQQEGCAAAHWGSELCALRGESAEIVPGLVGFVYDVCKYSTGLRLE